MQRSYRGLVEQVGLSTEEAGRLTWDNPRRALANKL